MFALILELIFYNEDMRKILKKSILFLAIVSLFNVGSCGENKDDTKSEYYSINEELVGSNFNFLVNRVTTYDGYYQVDYDLKNNLKSNLYIDFKAFKSGLELANPLIAKEASDSYTKDFNKPIYLIKDARIKFSLTYYYATEAIPNEIYTMCSLDNRLLGDNDSMIIKVTKDEFASSDVSESNNYYYNTGYSLPNEETNPIINKNEIQYQLCYYTSKNSVLEVCVNVINKSQKDFLFNAKGINLFLNGYLVNKKLMTLFNHGDEDRTHLDINDYEVTIESNSSKTIVLEADSIVGVSNASLYIGSVLDDVSYNFPSFGS